MNDALLARWDEIEALHEQGFSAGYIDAELDINIGTNRLRKFIDERMRLLPVNRHNGRLGEKYTWVPTNLGAPGRQDYDTLHQTLILIIRQLFEMEGHDIHVCQQCGKRQDLPCVIHHTKYQGATFNDLRLVCYGCNNLSENQHLQ